MRQILSEGSNFFPLICSSVKDHRNWNCGTRLVYHPLHLSVGWYRDNDKVESRRSSFSNLHAIRRTEVIAIDIGC